jgi:hypothetical protein
MKRIKVIFEVEVDTKEELQQVKDAIGTNAKLLESLLQNEDLQINITLNSKSSWFQRLSDSLWFTIK